jgi:hypothetical protein
VFPIMPMLRGGAPARFGVTSKIDVRRNPNGQSRHESGGKRGKRGAGARANRVLSRCNFVKSLFRYGPVAPIGPKRSSLKRLAYPSHSRHPSFG